MVTHLLDNKGITVKKNHTGAPSCVFSGKPIEAGTYNVSFTQRINGNAMTVWMKPEYAEKLRACLEMVNQNPLYKKSDSTIQLIPDGSIRYGSISGASQTCVVTQNIVSGKTGVTLADYTVGNGINVWIEDTDHALSKAAEALEQVPNALKEEQDK